jgi:hypothetical protein
MEKITEKEFIIWWRPNPIFLILFGRLDKGDKNEELLRLPSTNSGTSQCTENTVPEN